MASGTWFGETPGQSQAKPVKQQHTGILPNHVPEAVRHSQPRAAGADNGDETHADQLEGKINEMKL